VCTTVSGKKYCHDLEECQMCSGVIVAPNIIVTAGHCLAEYKKENLEVVFSLDANKAFKEKNYSRIFKVENFRVHPDFKNVDRKGNVLKKERHDIAIMKIQGQMPGDYKPAKILQSTSGLSKGDMTTMVGYGISQREQMKGAGVIRKVQLPIISLKYSSHEARLDQSGQRGSCPGDSGGPLFVNNGGQNYVWAITVGTLPKAVRDMCDYQSVVTILAPFSGWIKSNINSL
jgi:V8-like Glu-specific endopeptidase